MSARLNGIAVAGAIAGLGALVLAGNDAVPAPLPHASVPRAATPAARSEVIDVASAYAVVARTWSPTTRLESWRRELRLTAGVYRRALLAARPTRAQITALRDDRADSAATIVAARSSVRGTNAVVVVDLRERTRVASASVTAATRNEVRLRFDRGHWRVVGFTVVPGARP